MEQIDSEQTKTEPRTTTMASSSPPTHTSPTLPAPISEPPYDSPIPPPPKPRSLRSDKPQLDRPSIYVFAKTPQIKKRDGLPLLRGDIQFALLSYIFHDRREVFTSSYNATAPKMTFAELYIESMSRSSKCSRVVREKLMMDLDLAISVAMVSLLVNVGKMNTTLTFFPEMRAQLRTYHPIPSLQCAQEQNSKLLQDAPRIKSILKGVQEDRNEPFTWEQLLECRKRGLKPLTSPVSLIFLFGTYCQKMTELHFTPPREFYDLFNRTSLSSLSRANAFLWLCWHYLETDGSPEAAAQNPFGKPEQEGTVRIPKLIHITVEQERLENLDPEEEIEYGKRMEEERRRYLDNELYLKENPSAEKPVKKARGGVASRKAKANSMAASAAAARSKGKEPENRPPSSDDPTQISPPPPISSTIDEEPHRTTTPSKAGDLSFVLNAPSLSPPRSTPSKSPNVQAVKESASKTTPTVPEPPPTFTPAEPAHNLRARTKKRKMHDTYVFDDYVMEPWEEPDEAGYSEEEARRDLVEKEIRRRIKKESKKRRRERFAVGALSREWSFMQAKLHNNPLLDFDRLESGSLNESDGGEECDAILTALRRGKRRAKRRAAKALEGGGERMVIEEGEGGGERAIMGGKTLPNLRLTLNGHGH